MTVFDRIKQLADKKGVSVSRVATDLGFSENLFYQWKKASPKSDRLEKVADYFGVSLDYLMGRTDNPVSSNSPDEYDDLVMMFRKNEMEIPEERRDEYRHEVEKLMEFVKFTMKNLDEENKNK